MLAYLQCAAPLADVIMQNRESPTVWGFCILPPVEGKPIPIVPCAWAKEAPAASAATVVSVVNIFIVLQRLAKQADCEMSMGECAPRASVVQRKRRGYSGIDITQTR